MIYLIILIIGAVLSVLGPWWIVAPLAFIVCRWKAKSGKQAFGQSALALITLWIGYLTYIYLKSDVNLSNKMMGILTSSTDGLGDLLNITVIVAITAILATIVGGLGGLAGFNLKKI